MNIGFNKIDTWDKKIFLFIIVASVLSSLRSLFVPLAFDEITYLKLSNNLLNGRYYLNEQASTVTPIIPILFTLFKFKSYPLIGLVLHKLFHIFCAILGGRFLYMYLANKKINTSVILAIIGLLAVNSNSVAWFSNLYPESIIFCTFWGFMYYSHETPSKSNLMKMLICFLILIFTRYLYAVLGIILLFNYYEYLKENFKRFFPSIIKYSIICLIPVCIWGKYIQNIESQNLSEISYFDRFKKEDPLLYNIKCGLGLEQHYQVSKINGIPAFISLFVPKTGIRNYLISYLLIFAFIGGYLFKNKNIFKHKLLIAILLIMLGLILAGTGFNRYWLALLPGFYLGYYYLFNFFKGNDFWFIRISQALSIIYILNEVRIDILILSKI